MKFKLIDIDLAFKRLRERIVFTDFTYFHGQMGAGKSTIARLIDFCLGGHLGEAEMTPALQTEFVSANLSLKVEGVTLSLERHAHSNQIRARWTSNEDKFEVLVPARAPDGEVLPGTGIEVLSDLIFFLAGKAPPRVRRSKVKDDSELERLSIRDLLWYCYLDQDSMDSSFFHLESGGDQWKRLKSRDVLRFLVGFYQEQVAELETKLEQSRNERLKCEAGATAIKEALSSSEIGTELELTTLRRDLERQIQVVEVTITAARESAQSLRSHAMESMQDHARMLTRRLGALLDASSEIKDVMAKDKAHKNELLALSSRFRRSQSAREVLSGVDFQDCPRCSKTLPPCADDVCAVCGQSHSDSPSGGLEEASAEKDLDSRVQELNDLIARHEAQLRKTDRVHRETSSEKALLDKELNKVSRQYDSEYLSTALEVEKRRAALQQQLLDLNKLEFLVQRTADLSDRAGVLLVAEQKLRAELRQARELAERDTQNLGRLKVLFLDCLLRSKLAGFFPSDIVEMKAPNFLPEVTSAGSGDLAVTSFTNLGSGGKKSLFKCCFAVAAHRLAVEINALLPTVLIIDSPMKNISERENRKQWEGFHQMLYSLAGTELRGTQFIVIDKEMYPPSDDFTPTFTERHMRPNDEGVGPAHNSYPPLIRYYKDK
jgi:hypothetical protein